MSLILQILDAFYDLLRCYVWFKNLHNSIRDDHYLIGRRLHNFGETMKMQEMVVS
ncbi:hypothetical protein AALP_AA7G209400 [Arabis alpina]|uniref:Uncharacterized protein n=1 Tax=Arabis alpina TaxID=50452 RepID=A0A087GJI7_ARAAL|nr:hypothetical protein AALP_AA7G209400 [Arabis alpina]